MSNIDEFYRSPSSSLSEEEHIPSSFSGGPLRADKLRAAAYAAIVYIMVDIAVTILSFTEGANATGGTDATLVNTLAILDAALYVFLLNVFRSLLIARFQFNKANNIIFTIMILTVAGTLVGLSVDQQSEQLGPATIALFALFIPTGITMILLGQKLLKAEMEYPHMRLFAWTNIAAGICLASVVLFLLAIPIGVISNIALASILFTGSRELQSAKTMDHDHDRPSPP